MGSARLCALPCRCFLALGISLQHRGTGTRFDVRGFYVDLLFDLLSSVDPFADDLSVDPFSDRDGWL
jgi:hypothetical protein